VTVYHPGPAGILECRGDNTPTYPPGRSGSTIWDQREEEDNTVILRIAVTVAPQEKAGMTEQPLPELDVNLHSGRISLARRPAG
jgi:hypothetical protein